MTNHKNAGGLGVNWLIFGSNGHETKPAGGVLKNFTRCAVKDFGPNHFIKTICDPMKVFSILDAHTLLYYKNFINLDENGNSIGDVVNISRTETVNFDKIRINHYFTKSKQEHDAKIKRGDVASKNGEKYTKTFNHHDRNEVLDTEILSNI